MDSVTDVVREKYRSAIDFAHGGYQAGSSSRFDSRVS